MTSKSEHARRLALIVLQSTIYQEDEEARRVADAILATPSSSAGTPPAKVTPGPGVMDVLAFYEAWRQQNPMTLDNLVSPDGYARKFAAALYRSVFGASGGSAAPSRDGGAPEEPLGYVAPDTAAFFAKHRGGKGPTFVELNAQGNPGDIPVYTSPPVAPVTIDDVWSRIDEFGRKGLSADKLVKILNAVNEHLRSSTRSPEPSTGSAHE